MLYFYNGALFKNKKIHGPCFLWLLQGRVTWERNASVAGKSHCCEGGWVSVGGCCFAGFGAMSPGL